MWGCQAHIELHAAAAVAVPGKPGEGRRAKLNVSDLPDFNVADPSEERTVMPR